MFKRILPNRVLVQSLLSFLSVERLAGCHHVTLQLHQRPYIWNKFIRRSISETIRDNTALSWDEKEDAEVGEEMHRQEILGSVWELRMFEDAKSFLLSNARWLERAGYQDPLRRYSVAPPGIHSTQPCLFVMAFGLDQGWGVSCVSGGILWHDPWTRMVNLSILAK